MRFILRISPRNRSVRNLYFGLDETGHLVQRKSKKVPKTKAKIIECNPNVFVRLSSALIGMMFTMWSRFENMGSTSR